MNCKSRAAGRVVSRTEKWSRKVRSCAVTALMRSRLLILLGKIPAALLKAHKTLNPPGTRWLVLVSRQDTPQWAQGLVWQWKPVAPRLGLISCDANELLSPPVGRAGAVSSWRLCWANRGSAPRSSTARHKWRWAASGFCVMKDFDVLEVDAQPWEAEWVCVTPVELILVRGFWRQSLCVRLS